MSRTKNCPEHINIWTEQRWRERMQCRGRRPDEIRGQMDPGRSGRCTDTCF